MVRGRGLYFIFIFTTTAANRIKIYVNGQQITVFTTATYPSQNSNLNINSNVTHNIGRFLSADVILEIKYARSSDSSGRFI